jgi:three-Cys-motif partner protein
MTTADRFFGERSAQAVLKHGILTRYAYYFAGRAGRATKGRVAFIDGYAGSGRYDDGSSGSPLLLASQAQQAELLGRDVRLAFIEPEAKIRSQLVKTLQASNIEPDQLLDTGLDEAVDLLLERYARRAVFLFVDPFGLAIDFEHLIDILSQSTPSRPIDVLYHFSLSSVARMGRAAMADTPSADRNAARIERAIGTDILWREMFAAADRPGAPTEAAFRLAQAFSGNVRSSTGVPSIGVPVSQRPGQLPKYYLMLFSRDNKARWDFADLAGSAHAEWLLHCDVSDFQANIETREARGELTLFDEPLPERQDIEDELSAMASIILPNHLVDTLRTHGPLRPIDAIEAIYGPLLGRARLTHLRAAIKQLHAEGRIEDDGKGDFWLRQLSL